MSSQLTPEKLLAALKDNKSYSQTQPFLKAIADHAHQSVMSAINQALIQVLSNHKNLLVSKLLALRLVKDIFIHGNIEYFDLLDEDIEDAIITAAAYNPQYKAKSKGKNERGSAYFVETEQRPKNADTAKYGNSFVLLATEMVKNFAVMLPQYPDGNPFRFVEYYEELKKLGVVFQDNIYFEKTDSQSFRTNYQKWKLQMLKYQEKVQPSKARESTSQLNPAVLEQQQQKDRQIALLKASMQQQSESYEEQKCRTSKQHQQMLSELECRQKSIKEAMDNEQASKAQIQHYQMENMQLQNRVALAYEQKSEYSQKIADLQARAEETQQNSMDRDNKEKDRASKMNELSLKLEQLECVKSQLLDRMGSIQKLKQRVDEQNARMKEQNRRMKQQLQQHQSRDSDQSKLGAQTREQAILRQENERLLSRVRELENQLAARAEESLRAQQHIVHMNALLKQHQSVNEKLTNQITQLQACNEELMGKLTDSNQRQNKIRTVADASLNEQKQKASQSKGNRGTKQELISCENQNPPEFIGQPRVESVEGQLMQMSLSKHLSAEQGEWTNWRTGLSSLGGTQSAQVHKKSSQSLHKTQSSKHRSWKHARGSSNNQSVLQDHTDYLNNHHTANAHNTRSLKNVMTSVFPFMPEYFYPIVSMSESCHFRNCCALHHHSGNTFFEDKLIAMQILKENREGSKTRSYQILIHNKSENPITLKLASANKEVSIRPTNRHKFEQFEKVNAFGTAVFEVDFKIASLNFRFPVFKIQMVYNRKQLIYRIPIPITLLDAIEFSSSSAHLRKFDRFQENLYKKHRSERISIASSAGGKSHSIELAFPFLQFQETEQSSSIRTWSVSSRVLVNESIVSFPRIPEVEIRLRMILGDRMCEFETEFLAVPKVSEDFSKVLLQVMMFIFQ